MNSFAKIGRAELKHLFSKKQIFSTTSFERSGGVKTLERKIILPLHPANLEKEYRGRLINTPDRKRNFVIFVWGVEMGLMEIKLVPNDFEGKLLDLICRTTESIVPSHIVIAEKKHWDCDYEQFVQEEINIFTFTNEQKLLIKKSL